MKDKLDILFDLMGKSERAYLYSNPYEDLLSTLSNNNDAFLFLYESMPESIKPNLNTCSENFRRDFLDVIKKEDEKTFNSYFFSGMHKHFDSDSIRELQFKLPDNIQLKEYWRTIDTPKNIDDIIEFLAELWINNSPDYQAMFEHYLPKFEKINKNTSDKSRTADRFAWWSRKIIEKEGIQKYFEFCKTINVEPINFCVKADKNFSLYIQNINLDDLNFLINYGENLIKTNPECKIKYSFQAVEKMCGYGNILNRLSELAQNDIPENQEKFSLIWSTQKEYIKTTIHKGIGMSNVKITDTLDKAIKELLNSSFSFDSRGWSTSLGLYKDNLKSIIAKGNISDLDLPPSANPIEQKKLKI